MKKIVLKPLSSTTLARVARLSRKMDEFLGEIGEIEEVEKIKSAENLASMLRDTKDIFSESIEGFKSLNLDDKLLALTQRSLKSALVCVRILTQNLKKEVTAEVKDLLEKSGLFGGILGV